MSFPFLTSAGTFDLAAIMSAAWRRARHEVIAAAKTVGPFKGFVLPIREAFAMALRRVWAEAKSRRAYLVWCAEQDADAARLAALPACDRAIEAARRTLDLAEHADSFTAASNAAIAAARAQLAALSHHA